MKLELTGLSTTQAAKLGDAALKAGLTDVALQLYREVLAVAPRATHVASRVGLARNPNSRTGAMLGALESLEQIQPIKAFVGEGLATWLKTLPFFEDPRFMALAEKHADLIPIPNWHWNLQTVLWAVQQASRVEGDFVELGVFRGHTTLFVAEYVEFAGWSRRWQLYDTFEGIPDDQLDPGWADSNKRAYKGTFSYDEVRERFAHIPNIEVIKGRVPEVLAGRVPDRIAFLHVDMNNATAEIAALDALFDRITPGGLIVFDDYVWTASRAQYDAEKQWFADRGCVVLPLPTGQGLFVKS